MLVTIELVRDDGSTAIVVVWEEAKVEKIGRIIRVGVGGVSLKIRKLH